MKRMVGLIVNPVAGIGGRVGLKGSDGAEIQERARSLGAKPVSFERTCRTLERLVADKDSIEIIAYPGEMGEDAARASGFEPTVVGSIKPGLTAAEDTRRAAREMRALGVSLILFAGGDGTARDVADAIGDSLPVLGIPAGVKIHSAAYATSPAAAGELASRYLRGQALRLREAEVMDLDETAYREGAISPKLYGYLKVPYERRLVQGRKSPSPLTGAGALEAIALDVTDHMQQDVIYIVGPGTTTRPILTHLGLAKTLIGVDVIQGNCLLAADANEVALLGLLENRRGKIIVTPVGGQGHILGRGNQPISPGVVRKVGKDNLIVVSTLEKIHSLRGRPLLVDTGDRQLDQLLSGYVPVVTGYDERIVYPVSAG